MLFFVQFFFFIRLKHLCKTWISSNRASRMNRNQHKHKQTHISESWINESCINYIFLFWKNILSIATTHRRQSSTFTESNTLNNDENLLNPYLFIFSIYNRFSSIKSKSNNKKMIAYRELVISDENLDYC